jgi:predicted nucleic acid-binding protein
MRILIDTNVILDYIAKREPHAEHAYKIIELCVNKEIDGCIAAHTITNLFYILRKDLSIDERRNALLKLCRVFTVVGVDAVKIFSALESEGFNDLEDCLQDECAEGFDADFLVTRNLGDFKNGKVKAVEPSEFLSVFM